MNDRPIYEEAPQNRVSISCSDPRNPSWRFLGSILNRSIAPRPGADPEDSARQLQGLFVEAGKNHGNLILDRAQDAWSYRPEANKNQEFTPLHTQNFKNSLFLMVKDPVTKRMEQQTTWDPSRAYLSDYLAERVEATIVFTAQQMHAARLAQEGKIPVLTDNDLLPFGGTEMRGRKLKDVPASYLERIDGAEFLAKYPGMQEYIDRSLKAIIKDTKLEERTATDGQTLGEKDRVLGRRSEERSDLPTEAPLTREERAGRDNQGPAENDIYEVNPLSAQQSRGQARGGVRQGGGLGITH